MAVMWLAVVLLLILAASRAARLLPALRQRAAQPSGAIALRGSMALDTRRRLYLVEVGGRQALILAGGPTDVVIDLPAAGN